jgi:hypothetical protein
MPESRDIKTRTEEELNATDGEEVSATRLMLRSVLQRIERDW